MSHTLTVKPRRGKFLKNYDTFTNMDPFLRVTIGSEVQKSDVAQGHGKTPEWKKPLVFKITPLQYSQLDTLSILFEAFDEDVTSNEFIGKVSVRLSQVKLKAGEINTFTLLDAKNASVGTIEVEFEFKQAAPTGVSAPTSEIKTSPQKGRNVVGTLAVKPTGGKFEPASGVTDHQELYLVFIHGDVAYQSGVSEGSGRRPAFRDIISFQQFDNEEMTVRCFDNDPDRNEIIGEGHINIPQLARRGGLQNQVVTLTNPSNRKTVGELYIDIEFIHEVFHNPVKVYAPVGVRRGESISKKIKYSNPDKFKKTLRITSEKKDIILVKTESVTILPGEYGEIRLKLFAPQNTRVPEESCTLDIMVEDTRIVEESLLFKIKAL